MKKIIVILMAILLAYSCTNVSNNKNLPDSLASDTLTATIDKANDKALAIDSNWTYQVDEDKMTSKKSYIAYTQAKELLEFDFPYNGGSVASLILRKKRGVTNVYIKVSKGQFHGTYDDKKIRVRFDKLPATFNSYSEASDGSSDIIFLNNEKSFIAKIKKHKTLLVEAEFYQAGLKQMEFDISNLKWN